MEKNFHTIFVTVGTTNFNQLITKMTSNEIINILKDFNCRNLILQIGNGNQIDIDDLHERHPHLKVQQYRYKERNDIEKDIMNADLIIGHAGAGTCMDILTASKLGLIVINTSLMNDHQNELAKHLSDENYLKSCTIQNLPQALQNLRNSYSCKPYTRNSRNMCQFVKYMDKMMESK